MAVYSGCAISGSSADGQTDYFVFDRAQYMRERRDLPNIFPWVNAEHEKGSDAEKGVVEVIVSNSCGFFEVGIEGAWLQGWRNKFGKGEDLDLVVLVDGGEFCHVSDFVSALPKLLKLTSWGGRYYVEDYWGLDYYGGDNLIILGSDEQAALGATRLVKDIDIDNSNSNVCQSIRYLWPAELEQLMKEPHIIKNGDEVCYTKVLFIDDIPQSQ
jgi:hypothetical protein